MPCEFESLQHNNALQSLGVVFPGVAKQEENQRMHHSYDFLRVHGGLEKGYVFASPFLKVIFDVQPLECVHQADGVLVVLPLREKGVEP